MCHLSSRAALLGRRPGLHEERALRLQLEEDVDSGSSTLARERALRRHLEDRTAHATAELREEQAFRETLEVT